MNVDDRRTLGAAANPREEQDERDHHQPHANACAAQRTGLQLQAAPYHRGESTRRARMVPRPVTAEPKLASCNPSPCGDCPLSGTHRPLRPEQSVDGAVNKLPLRRHTARPKSAFMREAESFEQATGTVIACVCVRCDFRELRMSGEGLP